MARLPQVPKHRCFRICQTRGPRSWSGGGPRIAHQLWAACLTISGRSACDQGGHDLRLTPKAVACNARTHASEQVRCRTTILGPWLGRHLPDYRLTRPPMVPPDTFLNVATHIADYLCKTIHQYDGKGTWLGTVQRTDGRVGTTIVRHETLTGDLYSGTSGVGLFLAEMAAKTGNRIFGDVAVAAWKHAFSNLGSVPTRFRFGFYTGLVGIAYAGLRISTLLGH